MHQRGPKFDSDYYDVLVGLRPLLKHQPNKQLCPTSVGTGHPLDVIGWVGVLTHSIGKHPHSVLQSNTKHHISEYKRSGTSCLPASFLTVNSDRSAGLTLRGRLKLRRLKTSSPLSVPPSVRSMIILLQWAPTPASVEFSN